MSETAKCPKNHELPKSAQGGFGPGCPRYWLNQRITFATLYNFWTYCVISLPTRLEVLELVWGYNENSGSSSVINKIKCLLLLLSSAEDGTLPREDRNITVFETFLILNGSKISESVTCSRESKSWIQTQMGALLYDFPLILVYTSL